MPNAIIYDRYHNFVSKNQPHDIYTMVTIFGVFFYQNYKPIYLFRQYIYLDNLQPADRYFCETVGNIVSKPLLHKNSI